MSERLSLLLVDDDVVDRATLRRLLQSHAELEIVEAESGKDAIAALNARGFDVVLLDYFLPDATASELLSVMQARHPAPGVVALTGLGDESIAVELMKAGVQDYLNKHKLDAALLWTALRGAVSQARAKNLEREMLLGQRRHIARLEALAIHAPSLVGGLSLAELCSRAVDVAVVVLDADATAIVVNDAHEGDVADHRGAAIDVDALPPLVEPLRPVRIVVDDGSSLFAVSIKHGDVEARLVARVRPSTSSPVLHTGELDVVEAVFGQLALVLARSLENARLLRHVEREVRLRDEVMAVVSHDLRGPLGNALVACELLEPGLRAEDVGVLRRMCSSLTHMRGLVDDLVEAVRARGVDDESELVLRRTVLDVKELVLDAAALIEEACRSRNIALTTTTTATRPLSADRRRVLQVLGNLLQNAVKFTPDGGAIDVSARDVVVEGNGGVEFTVVDTGKGVAEDAVAHVFERFWKGDQRVAGGLGLGLAIARAVVDAHGGTIWCTSTPGQGARFTFFLPRGDTEAAALVAHAP